jgi:hypothetical protein
MVPAGPGYVRPMKQILIIVTPLVILFIISIGYASNVICEKYYWEPKLQNVKINARDYECKIDIAIPFYVTVECKGNLDGKHFHERYVGFHFLGIYAKLINHENMVK